MATELSIPINNQNSTVERKCFLIQEIPSSISKNYVIILSNNHE